MLLDVDLNFTIGIFEICPGSVFILIKKLAKIENYPQSGKFSPFL